MALVSSPEFSAFLTTVGGAIADDAKALSQTALFSSAQAALKSPYEAITGKTRQAEVIDMAVVLAELFTKEAHKQTRGLSAVDKFVLDDQGLGTALTEVHQELKESRWKVDTASIKLLLDYLNNTECIQTTLKDMETKVGPALKEPAPWGLAVLDSLLAASLQAVPFCGPVLSKIVSDGIASAVTSVANNIVSAQAGKLRDKEVVDNAKSFDYKYGGAKIGQSTHGKVPKIGPDGKPVKDDKGNPVMVDHDNDLWAQTQENVINAGSSSISKVLTGNLKNNILGKPLNATFVYTLISSSMAESRKQTLAVTAKDDEFLSKLASTPTNAWMLKTQNPQSPNQLLGQFGNRGISTSSVQATGLAVETSFKKTLNSSPNASLKKFLESMADKLATFRGFFDACISLNIVLALMPAINAFKVTATIRGSTLDRGKFGTLAQTSPDADPTEHDRWICSIIIMSYFFIKRVKRDPRLMLELRMMEPGNRISTIVGHQEQAAHDRRMSYVQDTSALQANIRNKESAISGMKDQIADVNKQLNDPTLKMSSSQRAALLNKLESHKRDLFFANKITDPLREQLDALHNSRLENFKDGAGAEVRGASTITYKGQVGWADIKADSKTYIAQVKRATEEDVGAVFPSPSASGFPDAIKAVIAATIILNDVHASTAVNERISITQGAVDILEELGFARTYTKLLFTSDKTKGYALTKAVRNSDGMMVEQHRLRWPNRGSVGGASIREVASLYTFAATVVAYVDLGSVSMGLASWGRSKDFLNKMIKVINDRAAALDTDQSLKASYTQNLATAKQTAKDNSALFKQMEAKRDLLKNNAKAEDKLLEKATRDFRKDYK